MSIVDLRSDTVTRPTAAMRRAIAEAIVGDDVLGDDPTVNRLQERAAALFGKEAALFVPSGTMANQIAIRTATEPGDEIICDRCTHSYEFEGGGPAALSGCSMRLLEGPRGIFSAADVRAALRPQNVHYPRSRMLIIENTNNRGGGSVWPLEQFAEVAATGHALNLHVHLDGARLMNACVALGVSPPDYTRHVDSVSMCFSKGLGAPIGSILAGSRPFIERGARFRKMFGGGMRQAGLLAAAALHALDHHVERLVEDHEKAARLAAALAELPGIRLDSREVETNIVIFEIEPQLGSAADFADALHERGVWLFPTAPQQLRAVTHLDVTSEQIDQAIAVFRERCASARAAAG